MIIGSGWVVLVDVDVDVVLVLVELLIVLEVLMTCKRLRCVQSAQASFISAALCEARTDDECPKRRNVRMVTPKCWRIKNELQ